jgi:outer membrane protein
MKHSGAFPGRGISYKWLSVLMLFTISLVLTSVPQAGASAQAQQQAAAQPQAAAQQPAAAPQQAQPEIAMIPVNLVSPIERAEKDGTALPMSLKDITKLALQSNLDIAIADTNEEINRQKVIAAHAVYDPSLSVRASTSSGNSANTQVTNASSTGYINTTKNSSWSLSFSQPLPIWGGSLSASWGSTRRDSNQVNDLFAPSYGTTGSLTYTQPLWRNLKIDSNRNQLRVVNLDVKANDSSFRQTLTATIARIQQAYWNLISVIKSYDIARASVELARITVANNKKKVEIGTSAPIDVTSSLATQASREVDLISAEERILTSQNNLKQLISNDRNAEIWSKMIVPTDKPDFVDYKVELNEAINTALQNRPELEQSDISLTKNDLSYQLQQNSRKWRIDLSATIGAGGTAGPQSYWPDPYPNNPSLAGKAKIAPQFVGGLLTSYKTVFTEGTYNWNIGFTIDIPLRNRSVDTQLAQTRIAKQQLLMNRSKTEQSIIVEIRNAVQALNTAKNRLKTAEVSRQLSEAQLDAENKRFNAGLSQNYLVLQRQNELSSAQLSELQAMITYRTAIITLQQAMFTLLEASDVQVAKGSGKSVPAFK